MRLTTEFFLQAERRRVEAMGLYTAIAAKGDKERGGIIIKQVTGTGVRLYERATDFDGASYWRIIAPNDIEPEADAEARIVRRQNIDGDLWVLEVEDPHGRYAPDGDIRNQ